MKKIQSIIFLALFLVTWGCQEKATDKQVPIIDVAKSYPTKELIIQDFAKVEYVPLETTDSFLTQAIVKSK